jgi:hypothetical protein
MPESSDDYRAKAEEYSRLAREAETDEARDRFARMEHSYRLLAKNAEWISATGAFIKEMRMGPVRPATERPGRASRH